MDTETIARRGTILRTQVGSVVHGCGVGAQDDRDEMGLAVEPPEHVIGLGRFEQHEFRTQPPGVRSGPGDLDLDGQRRRLLGVGTSRHTNRPELAAADRWLIDTYRAVWDSW